MKIRNKISIIVVVAWVVLIFTLYLGSQLITKKSYVDLEEEFVVDNLQRGEQAIKDMESSLANTLADWAIWDDSYYFMENKSNKYIESNLKANSFGQSNIDILMYFTPTGKLFYSVAADNSRTKEVPLPSGLSDYIKPNSSLVFQPYKYSGMQGLISLPSGLYVVASHSIIKTSTESPVNGTLVMARKISGTPEIENATNNQLGKITKVKSKLYALNSIPQGREYEEALNHLKNNHYYIKKQNNDLLYAYVMLNDIDGKPIALIKETIERHIYQIGLSTINYYNTIALISSFMLIIALWALIHSFIVKRIERLKEALNQDKMGKVISTYEGDIKVPADEISSVALLYHHATHDPLTGLGNRHLINQAFENSHNKLNEHHKIALLFIDIDNFKYVNDTFGHDVGDKILTNTSNLINSTIRSTDIAARIGGDEFVVLLINHTQSAIDIIIEKMYEKFRDETVVDGYHLEIRYSMGVSIFPDNSDDIYTLIKYADIALYHAKGLGKNQYQYYTMKLSSDIQEANQKEFELQRALDQNQLCLFYQPIYDTFTNKIVSIESLIRWKHPTKGLLLPSEIIPLAEKSGLIIPIGKWALKAACYQMKAWQEAGLPPIPIAVNISLLQIKHMSIDKLVSDIVTETGIDPHLLELELTETAYIEISKEIIQELKVLRGKGIKLTIDDFGAGYSGVGYLKSLPVSKLKIDYSFVRDILTDADDRAIILAIITIAHQLNLRVVAEGVETLYQYEFLKRNDVDYIQGNYFSPAVDPDTCKKIIEVFALISK